MRPPATVLYVDDCKPLLDMLSRVLAHFGYRALTAMGGAEAMWILQHTRVDVLVLDDHSCRDSSAVAATARRTCSGIAVVACCEEERCTDAIAWADTVVSKPVRVQELLSAIHALVNRHQNFLPLSA